MASAVPIRPRRGHPSRTLVDVVCTRFWLAASLAESGLPNANALEAEVVKEARESSDGIVRRCRFNRYKNGKVGPDATPQRGHEGEPTAVDLVEAHCPGTARFYRSAVRHLLLRKPAPMDWLESQFGSMPASIRAVIFEPGWRPSLPSRLKPLTLSLARQIAQLGSVDAMFCFVLWMKRAELIASVDVRRVAWLGYRWTLAGVLAQPGLLQEAVQDMVIEIDKVFPAWLFLNPHRRTDVISHVWSNLWRPGDVGSFIEWETQLMMILRFREAHNEDAAGRLVSVLSRKDDAGVLELRIRRLDADPEEISSAGPPEQAAPTH